MATRKWCNINLDYLPVKAHYFFLYGGMAGTVPFMQVLAKDLGISATAVGFVYTIIPLCVFFSKPVFGYITDFFRNIKLIVMLLVAVTSLAYFAVIFVPSIENNSRENFHVLCTEQRDQLILQPLANKSACFEAMMTKPFECESMSNNCLPMKYLFEVLNVSIYISEKENTSFPFVFTPTEHFPTTTCDCLASYYSNLSCQVNILECQSPQKSEHQYRTYNFWLFVLLSVIAGSGSATTFCLSDVACYEVLDQNPKLYGRQRLWGTISFGIITFVAGYFNDIATETTGYKNYSPGFYMMLVFVVVDLIILSKLNLLKANISTNICKDVGKIYKSHHTLLFSFGVYIIGALFGLVWSYEFWYLSDLGASQTLLGLVVAVQCLVAEVPFFFFSEWFIVTFGHFYCLIGSFIAFAMRTGLYVILKNPWMTLPIEVLHGVTFAIFYTAMTLYATDYAPPGTEATMLGVLGGIFEGLGVATGSLLGGVGFDKLGGRTTFFVASMISLICVPFFTVTYNIIKRKCANFDVTKPP